ncbi:MAG: 30S ribosomal protein S4 [Thaumarchaeota archaeon]|nr:30S ribosomal protein S4 [Nitrososphaerota archaeon]
MGDHPKNSRKMWRKPKRPLNYDLLNEELHVLGTFGLKNKRELWKAHTELSRIRNQARSLLALTQDVRSKKEPVLMKSLARVGLVKENSTLDDVLNLKVTDFLSRRLQTLIQKKEAIKSPYLARQIVVHGHVMIGDRIVTIPSYTVKVEEEDQIHLSPKLDLNKTKHEQAQEVKTEQPAE